MRWLTWTLVAVLLSSPLRATADPAELVSAPKRALLTDKILSAIQAAKVQRAGTQQSLYGLPINGADTDRGRLACARVVAAVLRQAGVPLSAKTAGVAQVEDALSTWHRVHLEEDVRGRRRDLPTPAQLEQRMQRRRQLPCRHFNGWQPRLRKLVL